MRKHKPRKIFSSHSQLIVKYSTNICKFSMNTISLKLYYSIDKNKKFEIFVYYSPENWNTVIQIYNNDRLLVYIINDKKNRKGINSTEEKLLDY